MDWLINKQRINIPNIGKLGKLGKLSRKLKNSNLSQKKIALIYNINQSQISRYFNNKKLKENLQRLNGNGRIFIRLRYSPAFSEN